MTSRTLPIEVSFRPGERDAILAMDSARNVVKAITKYAAELAHDAGLALTPEVTLVEAAADVDFLGGERLQVRIGNTLARTTLHRDRARARLHPADEVRDALFANRLAFLPESDDAAPDVRQWSHLLALGVSRTRLIAPLDRATLEAQLDRMHDEALRWEVECHASHVETLRRAMADTRDLLGIPLPIAVIREGAVDANTYRLRINDLRLPLRQPVTDIREALDLAGSYDVFEALRQSLVRDLTRYAPLLMSGSVAAFLLAILRRSSEALADAVRARFSLPFVAEVFRGLLAERFSLGDLRGVLEAMLTAAGRTTVSDRARIVFLPHTGGMFLSDDARSETALTARELVEIVRAQLARSVRNQVASGLGVIPIYLPDRGFEERVVHASRAADGINLSSDRTLVGLVAASIPFPATADDPSSIIAISSPARRALGEILRVELPHVVAINWGELPPESSVDVAGRIEWAD